MDAPNIYQARALRFQKGSAPLRQTLLGGVVVCSKRERKDPDAQDQDSESTNRTLGKFAHGLSRLISWWFKRRFCRFSQIPYSFCTANVCLLRATRKLS